MRSFIFLAVAVVLWLLWRSSQAKAATPGGGLNELDQLPPDPAQPRAPENPLIMGGSPMGNGLDNIGQAIFQFEGGQPNNLNVRNNNPGNLRSVPGMTGTNDGYATFADIGDGWTALNNYITSHAAAHPGWDFYDFFQNYLGQPVGSPVTSTDQGNSDAYAEYVASYLGVDPTTPVSQVLGG